MAISSRLFNSSFQVFTQLRRTQLAVNCSKLIDVGISLSKPPRATTALSAIVALDFPRPSCCLLTNNLVQKKPSEPQTLSFAINEQFLTDNSVVLSQVVTISVDEFTIADDLNCRYTIIYSIKNSGCIFA